MYYSFLYNGNMKIGIDLGGTNYRIGLVDDDNNIVSLLKKKSETNEGEIILNNIVEDLKQFDLCNISRIGFCAPGYIDSNNLTISNTSNLIIKDKLEVGKAIRTIFNGEIKMDNDANCAGLAEAINGAGKDYHYVYYITHSTGIGASFIEDGVIKHGSHNALGEIGSCLLNKEPKIRLEKSSAGPAIKNKGMELLNLQSSEEVFEKAKQGDEIALNILEEVFSNLAFTIANICYIVDPDCFVLGGGISNNFDFYYPILMKYFKYYANEYSEGVPIKKAILEEPGVLGASLL